MSDRWIGKGETPPYSRGHHVPAEGETVRAYVQRAEDGSYEVLLPNGLVAVNAPARAKNK